MSNKGKKEIWFHHFFLDYDHVCDNCEHMKHIPEITDVIIDECYPSDDVCLKGLEPQEQKISLNGNQEILYYCPEMKKK